MTDLKKLADPDSFGPGAWLVIHTLALEAKTLEKKRDFQEAMKTICKGLKCETCKEHCVAHLKKHPTRDYWHIRNKQGEDIGLFKWSWAFHNAVNVRLGKPVMDWDTAYYLHSGETVCTTDCGDESPPPSRGPRYSNTTSTLRQFSDRRPHLVRFVPAVNILRRPRPYNR